MLDPISYTVRFPDPATHYAEVEAVVPTDGRPEIEVMMAVWTPGSYLIREYQRHVEAVRASTPDGVMLAVARSSKNRWLIGTGGAVRVLLSYKVYCHEMSVRTNWVDAEFAMLNGAPTFLTLADTVPRPHSIRIEPATHWKVSVTALPSTEDDRPHSYRAADFDTLADSPIVVGNPTKYSFAVAGTPHFLVNSVESGVWDHAKALADVKRIVCEQRSTWGFFPYERFFFLNMLVDASGGLEHKASTLLLTSRWATKDRPQYLDWLGLLSHELFHTWNVKQLRPAALGPFDYEREALTPDLWIAEGLTSYYDRLVVHRAGISTREEFFNSLSEVIEALQTTPGRLVQSVSDASYDAWIKYYRPNENSHNTTISYYKKGAVIGFLLDSCVQRATNGRKSRDDVMRAAYERYASDRGFQPGEFEEVASLVAGVDLRQWFQIAVRSTQELDYTAALDWYGLEFAQTVHVREDETVSALLGLNTRVEDGCVLVERIQRDTPSYKAGFNVGDEIVAINDSRVRPKAWRYWLSQHKPESQTRFLVARRERLIHLDVVFDALPAESWRLTPIDAPSQEQRQRLNAWLAPRN